VTGKARPDVRFTADLNGVRAFLMDGSVGYVFPKYEQDAKTGLTELTGLYRMDVQFVGANPKTEPVMKAGVQPALRYYTPTGAYEAETGTMVTYPNLYPNIDLVFKIGKDGLKYDFVVRLGGDPSVIRMQWKAADRVSLDAQGGLTVVNSFGKLSDETPVAFQNGKETVKAAFDIQNGQIGFRLGSYDKSQTLVIDPLIQAWATYYGGTGLDRVYGSAFDGAGNVVVTGLTQSAAASFPATTGAFQIANAGVNDVFVSKFDGDGNRLWSTYYGGTSLDQAFGLAVGAGNEIYVTGFTRSTDFPTLNNQQGAGLGSGDGFILAFNSDGTR